MSLKAKQAELNEKAVRELMKLEANRTCFDCTEKRPMYICLELGTFVCQNCAGTHRSQNRKVKGIGMGDFTDEEVEKIRSIGNEGAAKVWLATWTPSAFEKPDGQDRPKVERFMKLKYNEKRWFRPLDAQKPSGSGRKDPTPVPRATTSPGPKPSRTPDIKAPKSPSIPPPTQKAASTAQAPSASNDAPSFFNFGAQATGSVPSTTQTTQVQNSAPTAFNEGFFGTSTPSSSAPTQPTHHSQPSAPPLIEETTKTETDSSDILKLFSGPGASTAPMGQPGFGAPAPYPSNPQNPYGGMGGPGGWGAPSSYPPAQAAPWGAPPAPAPAANPWGAPGPAAGAANPWGAPAPTGPSNPWGGPAASQAPQPGNPWGPQAQAPGAAANPWGAPPAAASNPWGGPTPGPAGYPAPAPNPWGAAQPAGGPGPANPWGNPASAGGAGAGAGGAANPWGAPSSTGAAAPSPYAHGAAPTTQAVDPFKDLGKPSGAGGFNPFA
ncbi:Arf-GAP domain and FG repeat-containing protein [Monocercomonoides exilis]|uniref:Arf-GAP domain and FG repeat-containing protein n=1 Tax=Monocercomonoides exilis TaxID=2049356 RepID=UPI003559B85E|nr:Arf-GAP domain and FG repeat-containing protein [Monocercomonoides exilis]|eukprot:MONOS_4309.1-p1 / transcript=MONOS_4309.1 / gene=MONOS_4309 / organism=Monocercomonoides_exilis_PA203 / gene_product=Arf-GAP domain and FG repeats-containing protein / transcript_product=Arf-GAP domain and FG repeats-containing protein / location=Mono_scaffold00113:17804-19413(-) / protein_length=493 / sequence_SO=supercontig / SO=protein_coding / is_pseudo=false